MNYQKVFITQPRYLDVYADNLNGTRASNDSSGWNWAPLFTSIKFIFFNVLVGKFSLVHFKINQRLLRNADVEFLVCLLTKGQLASGLLLHDYESLEWLGA